MKAFIAYAYGDAEDLARALRRSLSDAGYEVFDAATSAESGADAFAPIGTAIQTSDVVIALLTSPNPSVYFELGMAASANVPTLVASRSPEIAVFDLAAAPYVELTGDTALDAATIARRAQELAPAGLKHSQPRELTLAGIAQDPALLEELSPVDFERLVAQAFVDAGYQVESSPRPDSGFDLVINNNPLTIVEIKRYRRPNLVSVGIVRQLLGAMIATGANRAILVSSAGFTKSAKAAATEWPIDLMTIDDLVELRASEPENAGRND
jgi:hypothetical protein